MTTKFYPTSQVFLTPAPLLRRAGVPASISENDGWTTRPLIHATPADVPAVGRQADRLGTHCEISGQTARRERFALQGVARDWLKNTLNPKGKPWRTVNCSWAATSAQGVAVVQNARTGRAQYAGLQRCGSLSLCPICAARISEVRRAEIEAAMTVHTAAGGFALMVTWTHSHSRRDALADLIQGEREALDFMTSQRRYKEIRAELGVVGVIRAREVTYGEAHAWHPHLHDLWLIAVMPTPQRMAEIRAELFALWLQACAAAGLPLPNEAHGVSVEHAMSAAQYLAKYDRATKWGTGRELSKAGSKRGREGRYTPFDLLRGVGGMPEHRARELWTEYAAAMYGARILTWSRGLKTALCIAEVTDAQLVSTEATNEPHSLTALIDPADWRRVLRARGRSAVLDVAEAGGSSAVHAFLVQLRDSG